MKVGSLLRRRQIADRHVLDHAATQRAYLGHRGLSCPEGWASRTAILSDRRPSSNRRLLSRGSGLVQSHASDPFHGIDELGVEVFGSSGDLGIRRDGTHATHLLVEAQALVRKPASLSLVEAAGIGVPF